MTDTTPTAPPPGWLHDASTGRTRWWDGARWTEHMQSAPGSVQGWTSGGGQRRRFVSARIPKTNGYARTATVLIGLVIVGAAAIPLLFGRDNPAMVGLSTLVSLVLIVTGLVFAIIGTVVAVRRPTKKYEAIVAVVIGGVMLLILIGAIIVQVAVGAPSLDASKLESQIAEWASAQSGESFRSICPANPPAANGSVFHCVATSDSGTAWDIEVTVDRHTVSWAVAP
jgi:hypothetical protein